MKSFVVFALVLSLPLVIYSQNSDVQDGVVKERFVSNLAIWGDFIRNRGRHQIERVVKNDTLKFINLTFPDYEEMFWVKKQVAAFLGSGCKVYEGVAKGEVAYWGECGLYGNEEKSFWYGYQKDASKGWRFRRLIQTSNY